MNQSLHFLGRLIQRRAQCNYGINGTTGKEKKRTIKFDF